MGKLLCDSSPGGGAVAVAEALPPSPAPASPPQLLAWAAPEPPAGWSAVWALDDQQRRRLLRIWERGVAWKPPRQGGDGPEAPAPAPAVVFRLDHGGEVESDGNCLFTAARRAAAAKAEARELRHRAVRRFADVYAAAEASDRGAVDAAVRHLYAPDLKAGWGVHVVQEVKLLAPKADRDALDAAIQELVGIGIQRYRGCPANPGSSLPARARIYCYHACLDLKTPSFLGITRNSSSCLALIRSPLLSNETSLVFCVCLHLDLAFLDSFLC
uniref:OTU domain-containing protein n=1 Tax=Aegilops tauschii subsp. strangulata TaxID=200361 RepID=A0A453E0V7_AEGTS